jgi:predicted nucleic acid-binding protein
VKAYADTSFLASLYIITDNRHGDAVAVAQTWKTPPRLPLTPFGMVELSNVLARLQYKGLMHQGEARAIERLVREELEAGVLESQPLRAYQWLAATLDVVKNVTPCTGTRTLDAMHVALARISGARTFISFDKNQRTAAKAAGFDLVPATV